MKKALLTLLILALTLSVIGCSFSDPLEAESKTFSGNGFSITLTEGFYETAHDGYTACYDSSKVAVLVIEEPFTLAQGLKDYSVRAYAEILLEANADKAEGAKLKSKLGLSNVPYFEYTFYNPEDKTEYYYLTAAYKGPDAFWGFQFCCKESDKEECAEFFEECMKSVKFG